MFCHWDESRADIKRRQAGRQAARQAGRQAHSRAHTHSRGQVCLFMNVTSKMQIVALCQSPSNHTTTDSQHLDDVRSIIQLHHPGFRVKVLLSYIIQLHP